MQSVKELLSRVPGPDNEFNYYNLILDKAVRNEPENPDIAIECCNSLFQGISKSIVYRLDSKCDRKKFEKLDVDQQVKAALNCLKEADNVVEDDFVRRSVSLVLAISTLRNARGDISHGRAVPKELQSDRNLAKLVLNMSEALLRYMLASFFSLQPEKVEQIQYEANPEFNDFLDEANPLEGKPLYSRALYQQYYEDYLIQLGDYLDREEGDTDDPSRS